MAQRYLIIELDSDKTATKLKQQIDAATRSGKGFRVVGLFAKPGPDFCRCGTWVTERGKPPSTLKYGKRLGWFVCTSCRKPAPLIQGLKNLLKPEEIITPDTHTSLDKRYELMFYPLGLTAPTHAMRK